MKRTIFRIMPAAALAVILGCASVSTTGAPGTAPDDRAALVTERLVSAYEQHDAPRFMALVSSRYLEGYQDLQTALEKGLETAVSIDLDVRPERTWETEDGMVFVDAGWSKAITRAGAPGVEVTFGRVTLILIRYNAETIKLLSQKGDPVFP